MRLLLAMAIFASVAYWQFGRATDDVAFDRLVRPTDAATTPPGRTGVLPGMPSVPLTSQLEAGRITVFVFSGRWCPACRRLERSIRRFVAVRPDVAFKFIETDDHWRSQYQITSVPHIVMFDAVGNQIATDQGSHKAGLQTLTNWMNGEMQQAFAARR
ncbi:MAG: thioredoxin family protein [Pirellulales bacterium]|nr:thioredoxin family protein [Pirellulales bacterium]